MRDVVHLDFPDFRATVEELRKPELKKRPLALAEPGPRAIVQGMNAIARMEGMREGMPLSLARRLCRRLVVVPPDICFYMERHRQILRELDCFSPLVEGAFPGHYFVDLTGTRRLWGPALDAACLLERRLALREGLHARIGLGSNKLVSQVAANCIGPGDLSCVFPGVETSFLAPLPVASLPGVGSKTTSRLAGFNIQRIGQLASLPADGLFEVFGKAGARLLRLARGIDPNPVLPSKKSSSLCVVRELERDEIDRERQEAVLFELVEDAGWKLRCYNRYPGRFCLDVRYGDGVNVRGSFPLLPITVQVDQRLFKAALSAFRKLVERRIGIRRIAIELSDFGIPLRQMSLFPWDEAGIRADRKVQEALDAIRSRFGRRAVSWGKVKMGV